MKINLDIANGIRAEYALGVTQGALARKYRLGVNQIGKIVRGEAWIGGGEEGIGRGDRLKIANGGIGGVPLTEEEQKADMERSLRNAIKAGLVKVEKVEERKEDE